MLFNYTCKKWFYQHFNKYNRIYFKYMTKNLTSGHDTPQRISPSMPPLSFPFPSLV